MKPANNIWIQKEQCPCGDWKCFIKYDGEEQGQACQPTKEGTLLSSSSEVVFAPYVGQIFSTDDEALEYYSNFARKNGFSIRKARSTESHNLGVYRRDFVCYRSGFNQPRKKANVEHPRDRKSVRCGCDAKLYLTKEIVNGVTQWFVSQFSNVHNHELLEDDQVRLLPAYRKIQEADQERILLLSKAGFPVNRIIKILELEKGVQPGQLPFIEKDIRNFVRTCKKTVLENDALLTEKRITDMMELLEACKAMSERDGDFVFDFLTDTTGKVENIAWSYGDSVRAFDLFGDAVQFDITYQSITYGVLLGLLSGVDNHGKPIFFACALLQEENSHAFVWALQTFVRFMRGRHPQTIVTDLDPGLRDAIASELPNTKHIISIWYIMSKLSSWFSLPLGLKYSELKSEFEMVSYAESIEEFEHHWSHLITRFGLGSDKHISLLSSYRASWAFSYIRDCFVARITTVEYMRSLDNFLKDILNEQTCLQVFFEQVALAANLGYGAKEGIDYIHLKTCMPVEEHAESILTPYAFSVYQHELVLSMQYALIEMGKGSYVVRHYKKTEGEYLLIWIAEDEQIHCSCKGFEHSGILCRHALRLFSTKNYFQLPDKYFPFRWRLESSLVPTGQESTRPIKEEYYHALHSLTDTLVTESLVSKERFNYVHKELTTLLDHVKNMPVTEVAPEILTNNFSES
ncbi:putative protein FAR1-RELATED SEQUENCE 10 [Beta vulgaris subsp. vulgaris]|uniref:putative protein FAR1-RELATED SEQUENCE 10 n=1 Tax=Beta vulgaris subsp. vulgaris TaxID=3555 RepID=UPI00203735F9|nr:putative protein FAR1-RELATED SEQUENCE 10 [Beta vulgaris subsp. vulgaris]XP_048491826.1 putative protein FAR1-RELATED SEQUENCE 10 [Beta vulgaris subsp. vulgaris]XP_048491827.1 putative protein FAR1-RELATED SEQUENCE 10 [Beta vulgaris subsp. vulgaris]XP_048491833.1 putative protein FAR1-RELATED SEQUENCE 10 [Beta vulgaris subsp. vulgaris]XP_048491835.1 putative protein FAR1-RELATED SEQUENCE 10 [Beta vulgaris subsp. vulgaris]XP_057247678.1 putative protein FAR1-RELATED SEQUENCE 10 [Beta vulgari